MPSNLSKSSVTEAVFSKSSTTATGNVSAASVTKSMFTGGASTGTWNDSTFSWVGAGQSTWNMLRGTLSGQLSKSSITSSAVAKT